MANKQYIIIIINIIIIITIIVIIIIIINNYYHISRIRSLALYLKKIVRLFNVFLLFDLATKYLWNFSESFQLSFIIVKKIGVSIGVSVNII